MDNNLNAKDRKYQFHYSHGIVAVLALAFLLIAGNNFLERKLCTDVKISGNEYSDSSIAYLLLSQSIGEKIFSVEKDSLRQQMKDADPWIKDVEITRSITGILKAKVEEHSPSVRIIKPDGSDGGFLSETGTLLAPRLPAYFDLPLIRNVGFTEQQTLSSKSTRDFIEALSSSDPELIALVNEISESSEGVELKSTPAYGKPSLTVKMGKKDFHSRLATMRAFWDQELNRLKTSKLEYIDLRFADQVIAKNRTEPTEQTSS